MDQRTAMKTPQRMRHDRLPELQDFWKGSWESSRVERWAQKTTKDLEEITLREPIVCFPAGTVKQPESWHEYHWRGLFIAVQELVQHTFGSGERQHFCPARSTWAPEHSGDFYDHVEAVAHPDPVNQQWEHLLRNQGERLMLVNGIIWKTLHTNVLSSLMFGAGEGHSKILNTQDKDLADVEGFARSKLLAETNAAYLGAMTDHGPPHFWECVGHVSSQMVQMLLPLYNACGKEFKEKPASLANFAQATFNIVAYAGWLNIVSRLSPGVLNISWSGPGLLAGQDEKEVLRDALMRSQACVEAKYKNSAEGFERERRIKISAAPAIVRLTLCDRWPEHHMAYIIQQSHVVYYSASPGEVESMALEDYVKAVRKPKALPPTWLVFLILVLFGPALLLLIASLRRQ